MRNNNDNNFDNTPIDQLKCPLFKVKCITDDCAWYNTKAYNCNVQLLPYNLYTLTNEIKGLSKQRRK